VPTDFSLSSEKAIDAAIIVAKKFNSRLLVLHVMPDLGEDRLNQVKLKDFVDIQMEKITQRLNSQNVGVEAMIETGIPFLKIMQIAELKDVNVVMIGAGSPATGGPGTTAEKLMHKSIKPVWVIGEQKVSGIKRILCPIDFSDASDRALNNAIHLARQFGSELIIMHVNDSLLSPYLRLKESLRLSSSDDQKAFSDRFEKHLQRFDLLNIKVEKLLIAGSPATEIINLVQHQKIDLILMGSVGRTGHPRMLTGATARVVLRALPASIVVFKSENIIQLRLDKELTDIHAKFGQGKQLLENGFTKEAIAYFTYCLNEDPLYAPAWEKLADAHIRIGDMQNAGIYQAKAKEIREKLWAQRVESEVKKRHALFGGEN
jgi:nucleotide-binding universal stress UspA family protein